MFGVGIYQMKKPKKNQNINFYELGVVLEYSPSIFKTLS